MCWAPPAALQGGEEKYEAQRQSHLAKCFMPGSPYEASGHSRPLFPGVGFPNLKPYSGLPGAFLGGELARRVNELASGALMKASGRLVATPSHTTLHNPRLIC